MQRHIHKVHACLDVTCPLHLWQYDRVIYMLLHGGGTDTKLKVSTES